MRTLAITLLATLAGWIAGILAGTAGGINVTLMEIDDYPAVTWRTLSLENWLQTETLWAVIVAVAMLPPCVLFVGPFVFCFLKYSPSWRPLLAALIGGMGGIISFFLWVIAVLSLCFSPSVALGLVGLSLWTTITGTPEWMWVDPRPAMWMLGVALVIGTTTGYVAVWAVRCLARVKASDTPVLLPMRTYDY